MHIHDVDYVNSLLGLPDRVQATGRITEATGSYDVFHALYNYDGGPQVHIHGAWTMAQIAFTHGYEACFERGFLRFDGSQDPTLLVFDDLKEVKGRPAEFEAGDAYYDELAYFLECIESGEPPLLCPPQSARDSLSLVDQEVASIQSGQTVPGKA
jgi:predicted dehydrogenase